ncbi:nitrilase-related carbon-nitrogen hydrolase [Specibacter cremeus]|uniref:nitrilase-related carbon-nitrogen hydrolase n=1 Tax=Specibacter cremeus TaxID=1629051 RepID=UPI000F770D0F|nr:nitrilase-related carbon-nitrogen hydrolase [Specibacter cremeus]
MLLALLQANALPLDVRANLATLDAAAHEAASAGAAILLTPELFPVGYEPRRVRADLDAAALPGIRAELAAIARRHGIGLVYSLPAVTDAGDWHITATLVDGTGATLLAYAKVHLFGPDERAAFAGATQPPAVVHFGGLRTALLICYDVEFPEAVRAAAVRGAELVLVPTALAHGFDEVPQLLIRARALENHVAIGYANHCGTEGGVTFGGGSIVAGSDGAQLAVAGDTATVIYARIDADRIRADRGEVPYLAERRPDLYRQWGLG